MKKSNLRKVFLAAALSASVVTGSGLTMAPDVHAKSRHSEEARRPACENQWRAMQAIADPSDKNIDALVEAEVLALVRVPYFREAVRDAGVPAGIKPEQVSVDQIIQVSDLIYDKQRIAIVSSTDATQAVTKGLDENLSPYFSLCKDRVSSPVSSARANAALDCMKDQHWEKDVKPVLEVAGGGTLLAAAGAFYVTRRRQGKLAGSAGTGTATNLPETDSKKQRLPVIKVL